MRALQTCYSSKECVPSAPLSLTSFQETLAQEDHRPPRLSGHRGNQLLPVAVNSQLCLWFCSCRISHLWIYLHCPLPRTLLIHVFSSLKFSLRLPQDTRAFSRLFLTTTRQRSFLKYGSRQRSLTPCDSPQATAKPTAVLPAGIRCPQSLMAVPESWHLKGSEPLCFRGNWGSRALDFPQSQSNGAIWS